MARLIAGGLAACLALAAPACAGRGWHLGKTSAGLAWHYLDDQVPESLGPEESRPGGGGISQEIYAGHGFRARLQGGVAWQNAVDDCFICFDFGVIGHYFWDTRYASTGLRFSPDRPDFLGGLGLELGYAWFHYRWGISELGWDSPYPSGNILAGTYWSHQAVLGLDYEYPLRLAGVGFAAGMGVRTVLAAWNKLAPEMTAGGLVGIGEFDFPERPLGLRLYLNLEW